MSPRRRNKEGGHNNTRNPTNTTSQDIGPPKRLIIQIGGSCKKAKAHKDISEYTITKDDVELVGERVQDGAVEEYEEAEN
jgi:hypothetical protein